MFFWILELDLTLLEVAPELDNVWQHVLDQIIEADFHLLVFVEDFQLGLTGLEFFLPEPEDHGDGIFESVPDLLVRFGFLEIHCLNI